MGTFNLKKKLINVRVPINPEQTNKHNKTKRSFTEEFDNNRVGRR